MAVLPRDEVSTPSSLAPKYLGNPVVNGFESQAKIPIFILHKRENKMNYDLIVIGGGAAGFFGAIQTAERSPNAKILILEKSQKVLSKVKISGGGRCNVTHSCFDPKEMTAYYPRGNKELRGPFHRFLCGDMMGWLEDNGVETKIEDDGRVFPISNSSQTIIDCFQKNCNKHGIEIKLGNGVTSLSYENELWNIKTKENDFQTTSILLATGSTPSVWNLLKEMGHKIIEPVPSLFTFNIQHHLIKPLPGISVPDANVKILDTKYEDNGPLLITHWGVSGPAILKLSAWAARELNEKDYKFQIEINWLNETEENLRDNLSAIRKASGNRLLRNFQLIYFPKRLWHGMLENLKLMDKNYASLTKQDIDGLINILCKCKFTVNGKSTFKDEFVTCGGIDTKEVNFKTMESKLHPNLFFAGEVLNIDAVTGGFNFQAAWTTSFIAAEEIATQILTH